MTTPEIILVLTVALALILIVSNRIRADMVALLVLLTLILTQVVPLNEALDGFSRPAVITIMGLFILSAGLENTGVVQWMADRLREIGAGREGRLVVMFMAAGALLSLVMNNIAAGAVLLPAAVQVARDSGVRPSKLLIPLSFGTLVGGMATYFTTANIMLSDTLAERGLRSLGMLDFIPTGGLIVVASLLFMLLIGRRWLPERDSVGQVVSPHALSRNLEDTYQLKERMWEIRIPTSSQLAGVPLSQSQIGEKLGITVLAIWRGQQAILTPETNEVIHADDYLLVLGREERVRMLENWGAVVGREDARSHTYAVDLTEVIIPPRSSVIGKTLKELRFRNRYGLTNVALWREGRSYRTDVGTFPLQVGDALLMVGSVRAIRSLAQDRDFLVLQSSHAARPPLPQKAFWAIGILLVVILASIFEWLPTPVAMLAGAVAMISAGCIRLDEAYSTIEWRVIFLIAGMSPLSTALISTGLGERVGDAISSSLIPYGGLAIIAGVFLLTTAITQVMGGQIASLIVGPIAISTAIQTGINPQAMGVAAAIGCSTAFLLPTAHPVNVLMMGPGGYMPADFLKVGSAMTIITFAVLLLGMHLFWGV